MRIIYRTVYFIGFLITWPFWILRDVAHHKPYSFKSRYLGPGKMLPKRPGRPRVWLWALSMGEILAAKNLIPALEELGAEVIISSTTAIGRDTAAQTFPGRLVLSSPLDFGLSTRRFVKAIDPDLLVLVETDIWPGTLFRMKEQNRPSALVSARISPRSLKGYSYIKPFWKRVMRLFDVITTQSEEDKARLIELGASPYTIHTIGDIKFDRAALETTPEIRAARLREAGWPEGRWIVAGSTHSGEEAIILQCFKELKDTDKYPDLKLLIAPRNKSDFETVWNLIQEKGLNAAHRGQPQPADMDKDIFLLDTLGELDAFYDIADIALVGKSWAGQHRGGGHNPLEPAAKGKPVLFGPLTHNYRWMTRALTASGGAMTVADQPALFAALEDLLDNPEKRLDMGRKAADFVRKHQGATARTMEYLRPFIERAK